LGEKKVKNNLKRFWRNRDVTSKKQKKAKEKPKKGRGKFMKKAIQEGCRQRGDLYGKEVTHPFSRYQVKLEMEL